MDHQEASVIVHPAYSSGDADLVLKSSNGTQFRVHTLLLRMASDVFADMLSFPQEQGTDSTDSVVHLAEDEAVVASLLDVIYPRRPTVELKTVEFAAQLAEAADKYDLPDVTTLVRSALIQPSFPGSPLQTYALSCRFGWSAEADTASERTLSDSLYTPAAQRILATLDGISVLKLINLHRERKRSILQAFNIAYDPTPQQQALEDFDWEAFVISQRRRFRWRIITESHARVCSSKSHNDAIWTALKFDVSYMLDGQPSGDRMRDHYWDAPRIDDIRQEKCEACQTHLFTMSGFAKEFRRIWKFFPSKISDVALNSELTSLPDSS